MPDLQIYVNHKKWVSTMCKAMEDMRNESAINRSIEIAVRMIQEGKLTLEEIANYSLLSLDQVKELAGA